MKQTILIHGISDNEEQYRDPNQPALSEKNWFPWLKRQIELKGEIAQALEFPKPYDPVYEEWIEVFTQMKVGAQTTLIGHSCGGGFLLRYLTQHPEIEIKQLILVAPWIDPDQEFSENFFDFVMDPTIADRFQIDMFTSSDDDETVIRSCEKIKKEIPLAKYHEFNNKGHFEEKEFPELLEILK